MQLLFATWTDCLFNATFAVGLVAAFVVAFMQKFGGESFFERWRRTPWPLRLISSLAVLLWGGAMFVVPYLEFGHAVAGRSIVLQVLPGLLGLLMFTASFPQDDSGYNF